jgi:hypothetical protein
MLIPPFKNIHRRGTEYAEKRQEGLEKSPQRHRVRREEARRFRKITTEAQRTQRRGKKVKKIHRKDTGRVGAQKEVKKGKITDDSQ